MADIEPTSNSTAGNSAAGNSAADLRASHEDRDKVAEALRVAAGDGRLDSDELDERLERALTAKTYAELAVLTADLPAAPGVPGTGVPGTGLTPVSASGRPVTLPAPKELSTIQVTSGGARRDGLWVVPKELDVKVGSGSVRLDFTSAVITQPVLRVTAEVRSGSLTIITKPGIVVDVDEVAVRSGNAKVRAPWGHDVPELLRIEVSGSVRSGGITARPPRRSLWEWLRRAPKRYALPPA